MGYDGSDETIGYCDMGDIPVIKFISDNGEMIELTGSVEPWESNGIFQTGSMAEIGQIIPILITLNDAYPNPFNPGTNISFSIPEDMTLQLLIYDITGREVRKLVDGGYPAGDYQYYWNGRDDVGNIVSAGIYMYTLHTYIVSLCDTKLPYEENRAILISHNRTKLELFKTDC